MGQFAVVSPFNGAEFAFKYFVLTLTHETLDIGVTCPWGTWQVLVTLDRNNTAEGLESGQPPTYDVTRHLFCTLLSAMGATPPCTNRAAQVLLMF